MWIQLIFLYLSGLAVLIGGAIYYYFLIYKKPWNNINIWTKLGFFSLIFLGLALIFIGVFYMLYKLNSRSSLILSGVSLSGYGTSTIPVFNSILFGTPPNRPGPEIFEYFLSQGLDEPLGSILQHLVLKLFEPDFDSNIVILSEKETETLKNKLEKFIRFYRRNKNLIINEFDLRNEDSSLIMKYIFDIAPSNRIIANFFKTIDNYIMVERPDSRRMSRDPRIRELCRKYAQSMIEELFDEGIDNVPSEEIINFAKDQYRYISDINRYGNSIPDEFVDPLRF